ncbi:unnamed protein product [Tilletia laevis]|uniref:Uncharacterized protein n=2 Tax=Tilletia TaxID=13289 RepID=A0A9N8M2V1_9BASI|nr:hypothetical protein CF335_g4707 [Tilletia laevis]KAE8238484.1 hypothetical protein A4X03_0g8850 [Tilletia caries]CAD6937245.1 unnamed protein product [Tilletia laevis]CAD6942312.1 unnamed protein product [Tilletia laevis]
MLPRVGESGSEHLTTEPTSHPGPDLMAHIYYIYQVPWAEHTGTLGFDLPGNRIPGARVPRAYSALGPSLRQVPDVLVKSSSL